MIMNFNEMVCPFECKCTMSAPIHDPKQNIQIQSYDLNAIDGRKLLEREKKESYSCLKPKGVWSKYSIRFERSSKKSPSCARFLIDQGQGSDTLC